VTGEGPGKGKGEKPLIRRPPAPTIAPIANYDRTAATGTADRPVAAADTHRRNFSPAGSLCQFGGYNFDVALMEDLAYTAYWQNATLK
jgi:hypothetical protein